MFFSLNFNFAKAYAAIDDENIPPIITGTKTIIVFLNPVAIILFPVAKIV
jgi:hypothetical protein